MALNQKLDLNVLFQLDTNHLNLFDRQIDNFICLNTVRECWEKESLD